MQLKQKLNLPYSNSFNLLILTKIPVTYEVTGIFYLNFISESIIYERKLSLNSKLYTLK